MTKEIIEKITAEMEQDIRDYEGDPSFDEYLLKLDSEAGQEERKILTRDILRLSQKKVLCYGAKDNFIARCLLAAGHKVYLHSSNPKVRQWTILNALNHNEKIGVYESLQNILANTFYTVVALDATEKEIKELIKAVEFPGEVLTVTDIDWFMEVKTTFRKGRKRTGKLREYWRL